jgi:hypothetical protein
MKTAPVPWSGFLFALLREFLLSDIQSPFGGHHIHCYLFAPSRHKLDGYWHEVLLYSLIFHEHMFRANFDLIFTYILRVLARDT